MRRQQRLNLLATLFLSQGTPMLLAGDEFGNSQQGNNNAYAQDNETGWVDWSGLEEDPGFLEQVCELVRLRRQMPLLRQARYIHGRMPTYRGWCDIEWLHPDGRPMQHEDWNGSRQLALLFSTHPDQQKDSPVTETVAILFNATGRAVRFMMPDDLPPGWKIRFYSGERWPASERDGEWRLAPRSLLLVTSGRLP